jgi:hypothetical protein
MSKFKKNLCYHRRREYLSIKKQLISLKGVYQKRKKIIFPPDFSKMTSIH